MNGLSDEWSEWATPSRRGCRPEGTWRRSSGAEPLQAFAAVDAEDRSRGVVIPRQEEARFRDIRRVADAADRERGGDALCVVAQERQPALDDIRARRGRRSGCRDAPIACPSADPGW